MQLDAIETESLRVACAIGIRLLHIEHFRFARFVGNFFSLQRDAGRSVARRVGKVTGAGLATHALMPDLWTHLAARRMHRIDDSLPTRQCLLSPEERNICIVGCALAAIERAFRKNET